jgi:hypothetical protein
MGRLSRLLLLLGAGVGLLGVGVWALEVNLNLPDWLVRVAMLKLTLIASAGLLAGGALVGRHASQRLLTGGNVGRQLGEATFNSIPDAKGVSTPQGVEQRRADTPA